MKIESALKHFNPKSLQISDSSRATGSEGLTGTDLMAAIGMCQSKSPMGIAAVLAKSGVSEGDKDRVIGLLMVHARRITPKLVLKAAGSKLPSCIRVLSKLAYEDYVRSASTTHSCPDCDGRGIMNSIEHVMIHPGCSTPDNDNYVPPKYRLEALEKMCVTCHGKGAVTERCRCNGTGRVRDIEMSRQTNSIVEKNCDRCGGRGFTRSPGTKAFRAISVLIPELQERTWNRNWRPFFDALVAKLEQEESHADQTFQKITGNERFPSQR
ncbi:antitermination protein Q [Pantoea agglomerans]|uniref:antitermination protein Q n=1 Tax=Enterobacter agglomerans TaxID=549 RepID=UPI000B79D8C8|nr:antitermination protein [Pantoea agglomerans]OXH79222.1 hypothetical protein CBI57_06795 [Pantoea agglomerans]